MSPRHAHGASAYPQATALRISISNDALTCDPQVEAAAAASSSAVDAVVVRRSIVVDIPVVLRPPSETLVGSQSSLIAASILGSASAAEAQATVTLGLLACGSGGLGTSAIFRRSHCVAWPWANPVGPGHGGSILSSQRCGCLRFGKPADRRLGLLAASLGMRSSACSETQKASRVGHGPFSVDHPLRVAEFLLPGTSVLAFMSIAESGPSAVSSIGALVSVLIVAVYALVGHFLAHPTGMDAPRGSLWLFRCSTDILDRVPTHVCGGVIPLRHDSSAP